jgi:diguanylate cyclase (GGDEF)-like protein
VGLRLKLILISFLLGLVPLLLTCAGAYWYFENKLRTEALHYQKDMLAQLELNAAAEMHKLKQVTQQIAVDAVLGKYFETKVDVRPYLMQPAVLRLFAGYSRINPFIKSIGLYGKDGKLDTYFSLEREKVASSLDDFNRDEFEDNQVRIVLRGSLAGPRQTIESVAPVMLEKRNEATLRKENRIVGYVVVWYGIEPWQEMLKQTEQRNAKFFFVSDFGEVFVGSDDLGFSNLSVDTMQAMTVDDRGHSQVHLEVDSHNLLLSLRNLSEGLWLGALIDEDAINNSVLNFLWVIVPALVVVLLLTGLIFYVQVLRMVIGPVDRLIGATRRIAQGNYKQPLQVNSKDELGELALAFQHMGEKLDESSRRIRELAFFDPLTGLPNRATLKRTLTAAIKKSNRDNTKLAVFFIDLDDFKKVNDSLGHAAGDELLIQIAKRLKDNVRQSEVLAADAVASSRNALVSRRGGDEFNAVITDIKQVHEAAVVAERIIESLNAPIMLMGSETCVSASVGVAIYPGDGDDADTLLRNADLAMYEAKAQGKNNYHIFTEAINQQVHERLSMEHAINEGLRKGEFELYYQPKVHLQTMQVVGLEALIRWNHPERGLVSPAEFIPLAEESHLIFDLGNWVLGEALNQLQEWGSHLPKDLRVAINISPRQLAQPSIVSQIVDMAGHFGVPLQRLDIEVTETSLLEDEAQASQHLSALRRQGVSISLDDFGTGYSSLTFLRRLPIDAVKIDRSFVSQIAFEGEDRTIVQAIMDMCLKLGLKIVAEGIESADQLSFLVANDCHEAQGYMFSKPMPADQVLAFLRQPEYLAI